MPRLTFFELLAVAALAGGLLARPSLAPRALEELERSWRRLRSTVVAAEIATDPFLAAEVRSSGPLYTPLEPTSPSRPASWPGGGGGPPPTGPAGPFEPPPAPPGGAPADAGAALSVPPAAESLAQENQPLARLQAVAGAEVLARVGPEVILAADVLPAVDALIQQELQRTKQPVSEEELAAQRKMLAQAFVAELVLQKMVYADARRSLNEKVLPQIDASLKKHFQEKELPKVLAHYKATSQADLEEKLREQGTSLERLRRTSIERNMTAQWLSEKTRDQREITFLDLQSYYDQHPEEFAVPARSRWQQLSVAFSKHPTKKAAWAAIAALGRQLQQGAPFDDVARQSSDGPTAAAGGHRDWTTKGSLVSAALDEAIFHLPPGALSQILEDDTGFHIVRVLERTDAGYVPFSQSQDKIRKILEKQRRSELREKYLAELRKKFPVATIFDEAPAAGVSQRPGETLR